MRIFSDLNHFLTSTLLLLSMVTAGGLAILLVGSNVYGFVAAYVLLGLAQLILKRPIMRVVVRRHRTFGRG